MGRKNKRDDSFNQLDDFISSQPSNIWCPKFPGKMVFLSGYDAQVAIDDSRAYSGHKTDDYVSECSLSEGGCGYFHIVLRNKEI